MHTKRQPIRIISAGVLNPPVEIPPRRDEDAISQAFAKARETIADLENERAAREVVNYAPVAWSPSQHVRRAS